MGVGRRKGDWFRFAPVMVNSRLQYFNKARQPHKAKKYEVYCNSFSIYCCCAVCAAAGLAASIIACFARVKKNQRNDIVQYMENLSGIKMSQRNDIAHSGLTEEASALKKWKTVS